MSTLLLLVGILLQHTIVHISSNSTNDSNGSQQLSPSKLAVAAGKISRGIIWDVVIKTCDEQGAGTDASAYLKVFYETDHSSEIFQLDNPGTNDFERGERNHFKVLLKQEDIINIGLFWWPGFTISEDWCVDWVLLLNSDRDKCFEGIFHRWILHYKDPPTYAVKFHRLNYADCVNPAPDNAKRYQFLNHLQNVEKVI